MECQPLVNFQLNLDGAGTRNRTQDLLITSQLLYQLSYAGMYRLTYVNTSCDW